jgi:ubiquitin C-terminal hydrolase
VKKFAISLSKFENFGRLRQSWSMATSSEPSRPSDPDPAASAVAPPAAPPPPSPSALGWVSVAIPKQGLKKGLTDCHVGEKNEPTDLFTFLRALSNRYTATYDQIDGIITINRIFDTAKGPILSEVFFLEFSGCFTEFHLKMPNAIVNSALMLDEWCHVGPRPDFGPFPWSLYFVPHRAYAKNPDSDHPYNLVRRLFRGWLKDPQMAGQVPALFREFLFSRLSADLNEQRLNLEARRALPEFLRDLTGGSVRVHWARPKHNLLKQFGEDEWLFSLTVIFPWAIDILQQFPNAVSTDSTFQALEPYTLPILHAIIANESLPLAFGVSPTETEVAYGRIYDHILDLCRALAAQIVARELAPLVQARQPRPPRPRRSPPPPSQIPAEAIERNEYLDNRAESQPEPAEGDEHQDEDAEQETAMERAERDGDVEWPDDPKTIAHLEDDLAGEPHEDNLVDDVPEVNHSPMRPPPQPPPRFTPTLLMAFRLWDGTILTALPLLTDQGSALAAFVDKRGLIWKLCHRQIIEAIGANSLIGQWAARLLRCYSEPEWVRTRDVILEEMAEPDLRGHFPRMGAPYQSLLRLLQVDMGPNDKHHLAQMERWALWLRPGVPRMTNSAESVNGHINAKINPADDFLTRLIVVATHLRDRYLSRNTWCDRALKRNASKCWPSTKNPRPFSAERAKFYQRLHNAECLTGPVKRRFPPPNPLYLIGRECTADWELCQLPPKFGVARSSAVKHDVHVLMLNSDACKTEMSYAAWQIVFWLRLHIGDRKWRECNSQIYCGVVALGTHLGVPEKGDISIPVEAKWRAQCWLHCADWTKDSPGDTPRSSENTPEDDCPPPPSEPSRSRRAPRQRKSGVGAAGARGTRLRVPKVPTRERNVVSSIWHPSPRLELRGLLNVSATCYINAVLQCLFHLNILTSAFPDYQPLDMDAESLSAWFATPEAGLALSYWKLQHCMDAQTRTNLYEALYALVAPFGQGGQHDAHECLVQLLIGLEADLGPHKHIIDDLFSCACQTELCCTHCHRTWVNRPDPFRIISVPLQRTQRETGTLEECLSAYGSDSVTAECPGCAQWPRPRVLCSKRDRFCFFPPVLVFHLKRFAHFSGPRSTKLDYQVPFPEALDMSPYLTGHRSESLYYDLKSIVVHSGSLNGGHYVAYIRIDGTWYLFDDAYVVESDPLTVEHQAAYLLFYERRDDAG